MECCEHIPYRDVWAYPELGYLIFRLQCKMRGWGFLLKKQE